MEHTAKVPHQSYILHDHIQIIYGNGQFKSQDKLYAEIDHKYQNRFDSGTLHLLAAKEVDHRQRPFQEDRNAMASFGSVCVDQLPRDRIGETVENLGDHDQIQLYIFATLSAAVPGTPVPPDTSWNFSVKLTL